MILNSIISLSEHEHVLDLLPNTCINFQFLPNAIQEFTDRVDPLPNHKLYRIDNIYLYPYVREQIFLRFLDTCDNIIFNQNVTHVKIMSLFYTIMEHF